MPADDGSGVEGGGRDSQHEVLQERQDSPNSSAHKFTSPGQYPATGLGPQRAPPASFCTQQSPHRVQSSTNLDLVDCVGSDLLLAMNCLEVGGGEHEGRAYPHSDHATNSHFSGGSNSSSSDNNVSNSSSNSGGTDLPPQIATLSQPGDEFLPLAALAPPPGRRPAWLTAQHQQARVQNEHFPARIYRGGPLRRTGSAPAGTCGGGGAGSDADSGAEDRRSEHSAFDGSGSRGDDSLGSREFYTSREGGGPRSSPGPVQAVQRGGFGQGQCQQLEQSFPRGPSSGLRRPHAGSGGGRGGTPHLDESWTAVLNAPAGAELMEFLTEQASRALVLWNVETIPEDVLRAACESHGPLYYLRAEHRRKRVVFLAYYDLRDAISAHQSLGRELSRVVLESSRSPPAVHFSVELHSGFSYKEGSLFVHDIPAQATEAEVGSVFQMYGDLRCVARHSSPHPGQSASFVVDFFSIQDARIAAQELTAHNPWGHAITVEPAVRSEGEKALGRQLHATLNRWTAELTGGMTSGDECRRGSSSIGMSVRSSDSDSPPPNTRVKDYPRDSGHAMDSYTPMTSANTTPATTPGSTPPSGADSCHYVVSNAGAKSPGMYAGMPPVQLNNGNGRAPQHSKHRMGSLSPSIVSISATPVNSVGGSIHDGSSPGAHQLYSNNSCGNGPVPQSHMGGGAGGGGQHHHHNHPHVPRMSLSQHMHDHMMPSNNSGGNGKPHPLLSSSPAGAGSYGTSSGGTCNGNGGGGYFMDISPGYHGDCDDDRSPPASLWPGSLSLSPPSARGMGNRGSPPLRGMMGGPGGPGGLGYKNDRCRQPSLDESRLGGGGLCSGGARNVRCHSDGAQMLVSTGCGAGGGGNGGDEFSLDLKKVSKGLDKRTTIMIRNIPNKYTQSMLLQEIDASYRGAYDFFYLPIDFKNKCNVGYAFINFMDYRRIVPFFREFNAQRWKNFNSEKVCAISYARIQGKASMISRFQNSSLMEKDGEYRPLIFHSAGAERGRPEPFPASSKVFRGAAMPMGSGGGMNCMAGYVGMRDRERSLSASSSMM